MSSSETADCRYGNASRLRRETRLRALAPQWQWGTRYSAGFTCESQYCNSRIKKKEQILQQVNLEALKHLNPEQINVDICLVQPFEEVEDLESEIDEMRSYVGKKDNPRWLWHAIDHHSGKVLAYVFGRRKDEVFLQLKELLEPFGINRFYTDDWGAYSRHH